MCPLHVLESVARTCSVTMEGGVLFSSVVILASGAFALGQVLNFGSLAYVADYSGELHSLKETAPVENKSSAS